jgi:hypothetical protein
MCYENTQKKRCFSQYKNKKKANHTLINKLKIEENDMKKYIEVII